MFICVLCGNHYNFRRDAWDIFSIKHRERYPDHRIPYGLCNDCHRKHSHIAKIERQDKIEREELLDAL